MNAFEQPNFRITGIAGEAISQYAPLVWQADGTVKAASAATDIICGVAQNPAKLGEEITIMVQGVTFAVAGGAINAGVQVAPTATAGKVGAAAGSNTIIGIALTQATADGEVISVLL